MGVFLLVLIIIICILLGLIVLIQNPKGGGVSATFGGASQQIFGASRTTDVIEKTTWTLAVLLLVMSLSSTFFLDRKGLASKNDATKAASATAAPSELSEVEKRMKELGISNNVPQQQPQGGQQPQGQQQPANQPKK